MVPVGYTCSMVPRALLSAGKLFPVRLRATGISGTETADIYLSSVTCSYTRSLLEFAMDGRYDFLGGWAFVACCDHLRRLNDNLNYNAKPEFSHILDIPHKINDAALEWTVEELRRLAAALEKHFGVDAGEKALRKAIEKENALNAALLELGELRKIAKPPFSGTAFHRLMMAAQVAPAENVMEMIRDFRRRRGIIAFRERVSRAFYARGRGPRRSGLHGNHRITGRLVVADRYCTGSFPGLDPIDTGTDPFTSLARQVLNGTRCPRMMDEFKKQEGLHSENCERIPGRRRDHTDSKILRYLGSRVRAAGGRAQGCRHTGAQAGAGIPPERRGPAQDPGAGVPGEHGEVERGRGGRTKSYSSNTCC